MFAFMSERLIYSVRTELFTELLHKQISWFDSESRAPGIITKVMSENVTDLNGMTSEYIITVVEAIVMVCTAVIGGAIICW
jgi:hypothetical protein